MQINSISLFCFLSLMIFSCNDSQNENDDIDLKEFSSEFNGVPLNCICQIQTSKKNGIEECYDKSGVLYYRAEYKNDKKNGLFILYYPEELVRQVTHYIEGKPSGKGGEFYQNGDMKSFYFYSPWDSDKPSYLKQYSKEGKLFKITLPVENIYPKRCFVADTCSIFFDLKYSEYKNCHTKILFNLNADPFWEDSIYSESKKIEYHFVPKTFGNKTIKGVFYEIDGDNPKTKAGKSFEISIPIK